MFENIKSYVYAVIVTFMVLWICTGFVHMGALALNQAFEESFTKGVVYISLIVGLSFIFPLFKNTVNVSVNDRDQDSDEDEHGKS